MSYRLHRNLTYGLQNMSAESNEVKALLSDLTTKIVISKALLSGQNMANSIYGLQNMSTESAQVKALLSALTTKIRISKESLTAQAIGNLFYGFRKMRLQHD